MDRNGQMATRTSTGTSTVPAPSALVFSEDSRRTAAQIGPRAVGAVYDNTSGAFRVLRVVTDPSEARRILRRNAARFAIHVLDLHAGTEHYTGAVWTGSDRVLKAVAV